MTEPSTAPPGRRKRSPKIEGPSKTETSKPAARPPSSRPRSSPRSRSFRRPNRTPRLPRRFVRSAATTWGRMDKPIKVTAEGRTFYICCDGCEDEVKTKGKEVVAKLDKLKYGK